MKQKRSAWQLAKQTLGTGKNVLGRIHATASVASLAALRVAKGEKPDAYLLKESFERLGVTYIKLGQFIASTPSIFPKEYVLAFQDCLDQTTPVPFSVIERVLDEELASVGTSVAAEFVSIERTPIASASIAQVHKAVLKDGSVVALKVQKPHVQTVMQTDLGVLHGVFWAMERLVPSMRAANLAPIMEEVRTRMLAETDFIAESTHIARFNAMLANLGTTKVIAPKVYDTLTTKRLLTMQFLAGESLIDETLNARLTSERARQLMADVLDTWFLGLMMTGEFHADLHAGNVLLTDDGRVAFLDFGLVGQIQPSSLQACFALVQSLQANDYHGMAAAMVGIGMTHKAERMDTDRLAADLAMLFGRVNPASHTHAKQNAKQADNLNVLMMELAQIGKRHGIHFPRDFALLLKQLLYFDRFMVTLAPEMELFEGERLQVIKALN
ncbi:kinase [Moraxella caviae]|uniref:Kinase n=1 Tax=Moraxella caviae TaxID=34060 RepID=A0A1T0A722_9GAMM|nr:AarF/ABC1/UbiB kinase family protein [Moraxella caviae]OOR91553.1 kinase [Moraxella caviae]STZ14361.1 Probable ubiquinone biosynthesis protein UbiB [Moraxella caviae]